MKDLEAMNKIELRAACKEAGIKGYGNMTNGQMRERLAVELEPIVGGFTHCPHCKVHLSNGYQIDSEDYRCSSNEYACLGCGGEFGPKLKKRKPAKAREAAPRAVNESSTAQRPTKLVWDIADAMHKANPSVRRKDVITECQAAGVAFYTARTQYQLWYQATKQSKGA